MSNQIFCFYPNQNVQMVVSVPNADVLVVVVVVVYPGLSHVMRCSQ